MDLHLLWWLMVSAVVMGIAITKLLSALFDLSVLALRAFSNAGERLWTHIARR